MPSSSGGPAGVTLGPVGTWEPHTLSSPPGRSTDNWVWAQRQATGRRALGKVGAAHPSPLLGIVGGASLPGGALSSLTPRLPPAPEDPLAELLQVLGYLQEAHRSSPAGSPPSEPSRVLELQT